MTVIYGMVFTTFFLPVVFIGREEGVGLGWGVVDLCETETVGQGECLTVDAGSADDVDVFIGGAVGEGFFEGGIDVAAFEGFLRTAQYNVPTVGQGTLGKGEKGVAAHDDGVACGERLEALQVVREPVDEFVLESNGPVLGYCCYNRYHTLTSALMWGWGS